MKTICLFQIKINALYINFVKQNWEQIKWIIIFQKYFSIEFWFDFWFDSTSIDYIFNESLDPNLRQFIQTLIEIEFNSICLIIRNWKTNNWEKIQFNFSHLLY